MWKTMWMSFFASELPMTVVFVVSPLRGWARVAPPLVVGSSLRDSLGGLVPTSEHKGRKSLQMNNGFSGKVSFRFLSFLKVPKGRPDYMRWFQPPHIQPVGTSPERTTRIHRRFQPPRTSMESNSPPKNLVTADLMESRCGQTTSDDSIVRKKKCQ